MKSPRPPDPYQTAGAQQRSDTGAGITQSILGNPNTYTPYGSQTYSLAGYEQVPDAQGKMINVPRYNQTQTLSPDQMRLLGLQTQSEYNLGQTAVEQSSKLRSHLGKAIDTSGLQNWNAGPDAAKLGMNYRQDQGPTDRAAIENAMMKTYQRQVGPQQQAENTQLAARGMSPGGKGFGTVQQGREDAASNASLQSYLASGNEARQAQGAYNTVEDQRNAALMNQFNMGGTAADRQNALRGSQLNELMALRNQPINEIIGLMSGSQVTLPQFQQYQSQGVNAAPVGQYIGNNYAQQSANANAFNSGLFGLAGIGGRAMFG